MDTSITFGFSPLLERNLRAWKPYAGVYLLRAFELPVGLYGLGVGLAMLGTAFSPGHSFMAYALPGLLAWSLWLAVVIEATYITFTRAFTHKLWQAIMMTPVRLPAILLAEQVFSALKCMLLIAMVLPVALYFEAIPSISGYFMAIVPEVLLVLVITAFGHMLTGLARNEYDFDYIWPVYVAPMYVVSGILFPLDRLPEWLQHLAQVFPLTHGIAIMRPLMLGEWGRSDIFSLALHFAALLGMWVLFSSVSYTLLKRRLAE